MARSVFLVGFLSFLLAFHVGAQPANDDCSGPTAIGEGTFSIDTTTATSDGPEPCAEIASDIWFLYTPSCNGVAVLSTCDDADYDTALAVYPGTSPCPPDAGDAIACLDDTSGCAVFTTELMFDVELGSSYLIQVGGWQGAQGIGTLTVACETSPDNDSCADASPITAGVTPYSNLDAFTDGPSPCASMGSDVWFVYTADCTGEVTLSTCNTANYDSALAVYPANAGCPPDAGDVIACNDDTSGCSGFTSVITFDVDAGTSYLVQVGGWQGAQGEGDLSLTCAAVLVDGLACDSTPGAGVIEATWTNADDFDSANIYINNQFIEVVPGPFTAGSGFAYTSPVLDFQQIAELAVEPVVAGVNQLRVSCETAVLAIPAAEGCANPGTPISEAFPPVESVINVAEDVAIADLQIDVSIAHTFVGDLEVSITSPAGTTVVLHDNAGGDDENIDVTYWEVGDFNQAPYDCGCYLRSSGPGSLLDFNGESSQGDWTLTIVDGGAGDSGTLVSWCVRAYDVAPAVQPGADILIGEILSVQQFGRVGDVIAASMDSPLCNAGVEPLDWIGNPDPRHPFYGFNLYRLMNDRFEQIGMSWAKHGTASAQQDVCGLGCIPHPNSQACGVGCSDTYGAGFNSIQANMGPRHEIDPWTGTFDFNESHQDLEPGGHSPIEHRMRIHDDDLDPALNPGAMYFVELVIFSHDDVDHTNSIAWEPVGVSGTPGGTWFFDVGADASVLGPALDAWSGAQRTIFQTEPKTDGRAHLSVKVTDNGNGTWHYQYAIYNHDMNRKVGSFSLPLDPAVTITNVEFEAFETELDTITADFKNDPWTVSFAGEAITFSTTPHVTDPLSNPLRWGTLFNLGFDADAAPVETTATLGIFEPGNPNELTGVTQGPPAPPLGTPLLRGDCDANGVYNPLADATFLLNFGFVGGAAPTCDDACDANDDGVLNPLADALHILNHGFVGGPPPSSPFPDCGLDLTNDDLGCATHACP